MTNDNAVYVDFTEEKEGTRFMVRRGYKGEPVSVQLNWRLTYQHQVTIDTIIRHMLANLDILQPVKEP
jgi:hypothetical protein